MRVNERLAWSTIFKSHEYLSVFFFSLHSPAHRKPTQSTEAYLYLYLRVSADTELRNLDNRTQVMCMKNMKLICDRHSEASAWTIPFLPINTESTFISLTYHYWSDDWTSDKPENVAVDVGGPAVNVVLQSFQDDPRRDEEKRKTPAQDDVHRYGRAIREERHENETGKNYGQR